MGSILLVAALTLPNLQRDRPQPRPQAPAPQRAPKGGDRAQPQGHKPYMHPQPRANPNYYRDHGKRFKYGYYYAGHQHPHWSYHYWDKRYGTYLYYDPGVKVYYYWCAPHYRYYPVSYLPEGCEYSSEYEDDPKPPKKEPPAPPPYEKE